MKRLVLLLSISLALAIGTVGAAASAPVTIDDINYGGPADPGLQSAIEWDSAMLGTLFAGDWVMRVLVDDTVPVELQAFTAE